TLVNSLVGERVSTASAIRPTTRRPLLVHHPDDAAWFTDDRILPGMARVTGGDGAAQPATGAVHAELELRASGSMPPGLALLDAPDIDSVVQENRRLATQLLAAADLWIFVTTASRYADAVPWELLAEAAARRLVVGVVLDRVPTGVSVEVRQDLAERLEDAGLARAPLFVIGEADLGTDGLLPGPDVAAIAGWLRGLAADAGSRASVARQTLRGAVAAALERAEDVAAGLRDQSAAGGELADRVDDAYAQSLERVMESTADGAMLRGEVLARWQEFVGTGDLFKSVEAHVGRVRDRLNAFLRGRPAPTAPVEEAIESGLQTLLVAEAQRAGDAVERQWRERPGTEELLQDAVAGLTPGDRLSAEAAEVVRAWQGRLLTMVREEGGDRRMTARVLSFGVNGLGIALMIVIFASTGGLSGAEIGVAGGTALVAQRLLEAVFGDQAVRSMALRARQDLHERAGGFLARQAQPFRRALDTLDLDHDAADRVIEAVTAVRAARTAEGAR
ncbi:ABC transporter, partial [Georgenia sp. 10Sc9-8]|nr:ABC transporter [Georgenia halotolerans]